VNILIVVIARLAGALVSGALS